MTRIPFILLSTTDGSPITGAAPTVTISKDGAAFAAATNTPAEIGNGYYYVNLTSAETTVTNNVIIRATATGAQPTAVVWEPEQAIPTAADNATAVWSAQTKEVTIATAQADTFATASSVANIATVAGAIKDKTDNLPNDPAAASDIPSDYAKPGDAMTLTAEAVTAVKTGLALESDITSAEDTIIGNIVAAMPDVSGLATSSDLADVATTANGIKAKTDNLPANPAAVGSAMTLTEAAISAVQNGLATSSELSALETHGDSTWATATGFTVPADLANLATVGDISSLASYGDTKWLTATGFATPSDIPSASDNASAVWSANSRTLTESALTAADVWSYSSRTLTSSAEGLTAQQVWEYGTRTLTASPTDLTGIATSQDISDLQTHGDSNWNTATGFATPTNVSDAKTEIISAIPTDYAKPGNAMTLTSSTIASVLTGVWNYENRSLTEEISVSITTEDINNICAGVWSYVPRRLTSIVSDVIEPNKS